MTRRDRGLAWLALLGALSIAGAAYAGPDQGQSQSGGQQGDQDQDVRARQSPDLHSSPAYQRVIGIDSADSCQLIEKTTQVEASGQCPGVKTCTLQERSKGSANPWTNSTGNPSKKLPTSEYRPDCI